MWIHGTECNLVESLITVDLVLFPEKSLFRYYEGLARPGDFVVLYVSNLLLLGVID